MEQPHFHHDDCLPASCGPMVTNEASQASNQGRLNAAVPALKLPLSVLQEKSGLSRAVVSGQRC